VVAITSAPPDWNFASMVPEADHDRGDRRIPDAFLKCARDLHLRQRRAKADEGDANMAR
jgi:hypothetical protein